MKRALLVDTSRAAYPLYSALRMAGLDVWVIGGNPDDFLAKITPNYHRLDYSDVEALRKLLNNSAFDYLVPGCNDLSYASCAKVGHKAYPGIDSVNATLEVAGKGKFRSLARSLNIPVPTTFEVGSINKGCRVIVKPVDSYSGRGMTVLEGASGDELSHAIGRAQKESRSGMAVVEEFVDGQLISHSAFLTRHQIVADFVVQEDCTVHPFTVDTSRLMTGLSGGMLEAIRENTRRMSSALGLEDGLLHSQIIVSGDSYWFIEVTRRCPGDLYSSLIEYSTGYDYAASYVAPFIGMSVLRMPADLRTVRIVRKTVSSNTAAVFSAFVLGKNAPLRFLVPMVDPAQAVREAPFGRAGVAFFEAESDSEWDSLYQRALKQELVQFV